MKTKLFITGHTGMLAKSIIDILDYNKYEIIYNKLYATYTNVFHYLKNKQIKDSEIDITSKKNLNYIQNSLDENSIIIHTAAYVNTDKCEKYFYDAVKSNVLGTQYLIDIALKKKCKIINFSTTAIFDPDEYMKNNGKFNETATINPKTIYGLTKYSAELAIKQSLKKQKFLTIKPVFIYGDAPYDNSSMIRKILERIYLNKINKTNKQLSVFLDPEIFKDYMRSEYFAKMFYFILNNFDNLSGKDFIISRNKPMPFKHYLNIICELTGITFDELINKHIKINKDLDYLKNHNGISENFYKFFDYKLPNEAYNDRLGILKTYNSIINIYKSL